MKPACVVQPSDALGVALAIEQLSKVEAPGQPGSKFAIKGGGHGAQIGSSNVNDGVVIDMSKINRVTLSEDKKVVSVGAGAKWTDVWPVIEPEGLSVAGGRVDDVGVGGLTLVGRFALYKMN